MEFGIEINREFEETIKSKLKGSTHSLFKESEIKFDYREPDYEYINTARELLPYRFADPVAIDKKVDPSRLRFGLRIEMQI